jgi:hypothetical protein
VPLREWLPTLRRTVTPSDIFIGLITFAKYEVDTTSDRAALLQTVDYSAVAMGVIAYITVVIIFRFVIKNS